MTFHAGKEISPYHKGHPLIFKEPSDEQIKAIYSKILEEGETRKKKESIICKNCGNEITTAEYSIAVGGQHAHIFTNPLGVTFHIGCFSRAWGCFVYGIPTYEATWFAEFTWCIAVCANCFTHLGWYYQSGKESFYGLIMANLAKNNKIQ
ncbi:MAG TPA: cereblon family protein [Syntrophales bacterium]|nr:cereblon family protein [Syntrophales bacterium]